MHDMHMPMHMHMHMSPHLTSPHFTSPHLTSVTSPHLTYQDLEKEWYSWRQQVDRKGKELAMLRCATNSSPSFEFKQKCY